MAGIVFLDREMVLKLHQCSLDEHGGMAGIRDLNGLESAIAQPQHDYHYGGADIFGVAASYAFHIAEAQAFVDGNKRAAIGSALFCLQIAGIEIYTCEDTLYNAMIAIARRELDKAGFAQLLRELYG